MDPERSLNHSDEKNALIEVPEVADGGFKAWITVAGAWCMLFGTYGYIYSFGVYQDVYTRTFLSEYTPSSIAWIGSFQLMMPFALGIMSGKLFDAGYFHVLQIFGSVTYTFSLFMLSLAKPHQYYQVFLCQGVGMGIGIGFVFVPTVSVLTQHFKRHRALSSGIALSGTSIGAVIFPIMLNNLIPMIGFAEAVRATAWLVLASLLLGNCLMRAAPLSEDSRNKISPPDFMSFFKDHPYMWTVFGGSVATFGIYFPVIYLQLFAVQHNVAPTLAFYSIAIMNAASGVGRIVGSYLADVYGPFNMQIICALVSGAAVWAVLGVHNSSSLIVISIFYGVFCGTWLSLCVATLASMARSRGEAGARTGLALALGSVGTLASAPVQGALLTDTFLWHRPVAFSGSVLIVSAFLLVPARTLLVKERATQKV